MAVRARLMLLRLGVCGRPAPIMLLMAKLLFVLAMDAAMPARDAAPAMLLPPRLS